MYHSVLTSQEGSYDYPSQKIFFPASAAYVVHSALVDAEGFGGARLESDYYQLNPPFLECSSPVLWERLYGNGQGETPVEVRISVNYFSKQSFADPVVQSMTSAVIGRTLSDTSTQKEKDAISKRQEIFAKHFVDGQFSLDNGLYKEAVLNFGTVVEVILNSKLAKVSFDNLIKNSNYSSKEDMDNIRLFRNRVHPDKLSNISDVERKDALECRAALDRILIEILDITIL